MLKQSDPHEARVSADVVPAPGVTREAAPFGLESRIRIGRPRKGTVGEQLGHLEQPDVQRAEHRAPGSGLDDEDPQPLRAAG